jgi:GxxExxY protein
VIGAAIEVHREFQSGFYEAVYQEAMEIELADRGIPFVPLMPLKITYKGRVLQKEYIADLVCFGQIIVELKVMKELTSREEQQLLHYLKATNLRVGLLINFGDHGRLDWKRMVR